MKKILINKILLSVVASAVAIGSFGAMALQAAAFEAPLPDTGAAGEISNGGEWSIYSSHFAKIRGTFQEQTGSVGTLEVTGSAGIGAAFKFDLSTKDTNEMAEGKVIKSAKLRLTPMISKPNTKQKLYKIDNSFTTTDGKMLIDEFTVPRTTTDNFDSDSNIKALTEEGINSYPDALSKWQTDIDVTGEVITAEDALSLLIEYGSGNVNKTEYAVSDISLNWRGQACPLLYSNGTVTEYSKWVYPQIVFEYSDKENYKNAYADFIKANSEISAGKVTETSGISLSAAENGSSFELDLYGEGEQPVKIDGTSIVFNDEYVGNDDIAYVKLIVTNTGEDGDNAQYSRLVTIPVEYTRSNTISFDTEKNPKGEISVTSNGKTYTDGTAYAKQGGTFTVNVGANTGYEANVTVTAEGGETVDKNSDGTYTMPDGDVIVSVSYEKNTYGTTRTAAVNSASIRANGTVNGENVTIAASRLAFFKFDLSGYNKDLITSAKLSVSADNTSNRVSTAIFYVPNNDWTESSGLSTGFCITDGDETTRLDNFKGVNLFNNTTTYKDVAPEVTEDMLDKSNGEADLSSAKDGVLKDYFLGAYDADLTFDVTDAVREALERNDLDNDGNGMITIMVYSPRTTGFDIKSVTNAPSLDTRPSLTITESSAYLPDEELITEINTAADMEVFAEIVSGGNDYAGKTVTLNCDIDLSDKYNENGKSWTPIGTGTQPFAGVFEGNNHSVNGLHIDEDGVSLGLFGAVSGTVRNLTVSGDISGSSVIGGIAGWSNGTIENCHSSVNITAEREAGGITGTLSGEGRISDCSNSGNILINDKETYAGGIAAHNFGGIINNCENTGKITNGSNGFRNRIGGIVGYLDRGEIRSSDNSGAVRSEAEYSTYAADEAQNYAGGIAGYSNKGIILNCSNIADVYNAVDYAGGIAGYLHGRDSVTECRNDGSVFGKGYVGGIAGSSDSTISNCSNTGDVTGTDMYVGGIVGYLSSGNINDCCNSGMLEGSDNVGEIFGFNASGTVQISQEEPTEFKAEYIDGMAVVTAPKPGEYTLIFAAYDNQNVLKSLEIQTVTFDSAGKQTFAPQNFNTDGAGTIKLMLWDSIVGMQPQCDADIK